MDLKALFILSMIVAATIVFLYQPDNSTTTPAASQEPIAKLKNSSETVKTVVVSEKHLPIKLRFEICKKNAKLGGLLVMARMKGADQQKLEELTGDNPYAKKVLHAITVWNFDDPDWNRTALFDNCLEEMDL